MTKLPLIVLTAPSLGFLTKLVDLEVDENVDLKGLGNLFALLYGLIMIFTIRMLSDLSSLIFAVIIAVVSAGKIDNLSHGMGVGTALAGTLVLGVPSINRFPFLLFLSTALLDEISSDLADFEWITGRFSAFLKTRPFLEISTIAYSIYAGNIGFWIFIFIYDVSYQITSKIARYRLPNKVN